MKLTLLCLRLTRHSDSRSILTALSREAGLVALAVPAGAGREARRLKALTMPLSVLTCEATRRPGTDILPLRQAAAAAVAPSLHTNPLKQMTAMFMAEILEAVVRRGGADSALWDFAAGSAAWLDAAGNEATANFHLIFLLRLTAFAGIEPDITTYRRGRVLDLRDGVWRSAPPLHPDWLEARAARVAAWLCGLDYGSAGRFSMSRDMRREALDQTLRYFSLHTAPLGQLKSLGVLRSLV